VTAAPPRALLFDVFGTLVDWRGGMTRAGEQAGRRLGVDADWAAVADSWRARYQPALDTVRRGERPWVVLDVLHREALDAVLDEHGLGDRVPPAERDELTRGWHRLDPWPDVPAAMRRLRAAFPVAPNSTAHMALIVELSRRAGLTWDAVGGAELARAYKPDPETYLRSAAALGAAPAETMMVAAHNGDLLAAAECGLRTAFVARPAEHGPAQATDREAAEGVELAVGDLVELAERLGA
jgi:2-haloacid dehalogenase